MGWSVYLCDPETKELVTVPLFQEGSTQQVGGSDVAVLSITYNYSKYYYEELYKEEGLRGLHGLAAQSTVERLEAAVEKLGAETSGDYWAATPGNAGFVLNILLAWAKEHPHAVWEVS